MRAVMLDVPAHLLAERRRLGLDLFDEVWEGVLHMVPAPSNEHQRVGSALVARLYDVAGAAGLEVRYEFGLYDPAITGHESFRVPDLVVFEPAVGADRGVEGAAALAVEIASPGDESLEKLPFYERVGVREYLIIDRDSKALRYWCRVDDELVEADTADGVTLACLPVTLRTEAQRLHVKTPGAERQI